jgi:peptidyl-prolyl cis-trans isomerase-like protein 2
MTAKDLIVLNMKKSTNGKWQCPVTLDEFTDGSHIVAIKTTGNVYSYEAVQKLNIERKDWRDLSTLEPFDRSDIIHLHDPANLNHKLAKNFYHITNKLSYRPDSDGELSSKMNLDPTTEQIIRASRAASSTTPQPLSAATAGVPGQKLIKSAQATASFTATNVTYAPEPEKSVTTSKTSRKGRVQLVTNFGTLELILHCDLCPKTCENFLLLIDRGFYDGITFHRLIKNFMIQGGDPDGTGKGGESAWGDPFEDEIVGSLKHDSRGVLSMANKGRNTNTSQFFILFKSASHLDGKHTVFGKLTQESMSVLKSIEEIETDAEARPKEPIRIIKAGIIENPLDSHAMAQEKAQEAALKAKKAQEEKDRKERGLWYSNPSAMPSSAASSSSSSASSTGVGKYITSASRPDSSALGGTEKKRSLNTMSAPPPAKKQKTVTGWNVF